MVVPRNASARIEESQLSSGTQSVPQSIREHQESLARAAGCEEIVSREDVATPTTRVTWPLPADREEHWRVNALASGKPERTSPLRASECHSWFTPE